jgi:uncharacterized protein (DUF2147 family)
MTPRILAFILLTASLPAFSQDVIVGKWHTIDDTSLEVRSVVELFERNGELFGRVIKIFPKPSEDPDPVCTECASDDDRFKKKIIGMEIIRGLKKVSDGYEGGEILDPEVGKTYRCRIWLEKGQLKVRGYWGPFFRTQTWKRVQ